MAKALDVYLNKDFVGQLMQDEGGQMVFDYAESWLEKPGACPLSQSLPLRKERFARKECRGFFAGILPEESKREIIARNLGISARNDYAMLERIGGECAGAVTFVPAGEPLPEHNYSYRKLRQPSTRPHCSVSARLIGASAGIVRFRGKRVQKFGPHEHTLKMGTDWPLMAIMRQVKPPRFA